MFLSGYDREQEMGGLLEYTRYDGLALADLVRRREVTPAELVETALAAINRVNPQLNAVVTRLDDLARAQATAGPLAGGPLPDAPFAGVPFLLKDLHGALAGVPMTAGSRLLANHRPEQDAEVVARYKRAGLIVLGKTNTPEFGLLPVTEPPLFGPARNPWNPDLTPGGSSGGSAAAVAAGMVPLAHGNDGGGSIRIPASACGLFGLKPTRGRVPLGPDAVELWMGCVVQHVLSRSVRDSAAALDATAGGDPGAPYEAPPSPAEGWLAQTKLAPDRLRIGFTTKSMLDGPVHADCVAAVDAAATLLTDLGHTVEQAAPELDGPEIAAAFLLMVAGEFAADLSEAERHAGEPASPLTVDTPALLLNLLASQYSAAELAKALRRLRLVGPVMARFHQSYDLWLTPTLARPPVPIGSLLPTGLEATAQRLLARLGWGALVRTLGSIEASADRTFAFTPFTPVANVTGQPAMSVPLHWSGDGLPIGVQFVARFGDEATLFRLAAQLEQAQPWLNRHPLIWAG
jgi:amidase